MSLSSDSFLNNQERHTKKPSFSFWKEGVKQKQSFFIKAPLKAYVRQQSSCPRPLKERRHPLPKPIWRLFYLADIDNFSRVRDVINSYLLLCHFFIFIKWLISFIPKYVCIYIQKGDAKIQLLFYFAKNKLMKVCIYAQFFFFLYDFITVLMHVLLYFAYFNFNL